MKIGFDAKRAFHNFRGLGNYSRDLLAGLSRYNPNEEYYLFTPEFSDERAVRWLDQYKKFNIITPNSFLLKKIPSMWRSFFISEEIKKLDLDIFHGLSHELPSGIEKSGVKSIVTIHDLIFLRYPNFFPWVDRQVYLKKVKYACEYSDIIIAICEQTKEDLVNFLGVNPKKIRVVYQSCNPRYYTPMDEEKVTKVLHKYDITNKFILNVGALEPRKNTMNLVKAYSKLKKAINFDLIIVGDGGDYKKELLGLITSLGLEGRVRVLSDVSSSDLPVFYQASSLFCYPSLFEGFGIPIIEALFSKTPVITSKGSCFPEAGGPNSIYIDPEDPDDIALQIEKVLTDEDLKYSMIENGRNFVEKFHRSNTTADLMKVYREL